MSVSQSTVAVTAGNWTDATINNPTSLHASVVSTVGDDKVEVSFDGGTTVHDTLGPLAERPMERVYRDVNGYKVSFRCASNATVHLTREK